MTDSVGAALRTGPRYLGTRWPWRSLACLVVAGILSCATVIGIVPVLLLGLTRRLRTALWEPMLRAHCARLRLIDPSVAERADAEVRTSADEQRVPTVRHVAYVLAAAVSGGVAALLAVFAVVIVGVLLAAPLVVRDDRFDLGAWTVETVSGAWGLALCGLVVLALLAVVAGGWAAAEAQLARLLLGFDADPWRLEAARLETTRSALLDAEGSERALLESELHDRVQHRLVALSMSLGLAEAADADGPAGRLAADAHRQVDETLAELRAVLLGYSPRALIERGLAPALADLVADVPLDVDVRLDGLSDRRLPAPVEHMSYVLVSEALTNAVRHARARHVTVRGGRVGGTWVLTVADDGVGGAQLAAGRGLDRLSGRVGAVDGTLAVTSPVGGPTTIRMECPV
ncbi:two-component sensor histidine kinase [Rhodococcus hoagii]|uniref:histidine kinase n=1 Tax=Rhodococcus hoagii (strain 103S) TaxID=685727 RepID=A0A3S5Y1L1_RHOH1|nr:histidine kinase [Prescottella equi]NKR89102.1 two-component sensor histidine kinase [Prescottella equi]NKS04996.1 two-component sensor histidine kinase [Prescottella equi]NKS95514.1 two-component sensor histidine kinase [Prescottella equi]NKT11350.1 two-component sensor histidine kinase [Prescottella equi]NKT16982.1 two-component sensor histidine kinase [Prescottella equi]